MGSAFYPVELRRDHGVRDLVLRGTHLDGLVPIEVVREVYRKRVAPLAKRCDALQAHCRELRDELSRLQLRRALDCDGCQRVTVLRARTSRSAHAFMTCALICFVLLGALVAFAGR